MKRVMWLLLGLAVVVLVASPILAAEKAAKGKKPGRDPGALRGEYAIMASECELTDQQKADLKAKVKARVDAQKAWMEANGEKVSALREAYKKAREAKDADAAKKITAVLVRTQYVVPGCTSEMMTPEFFSSLEYQSSCQPGGPSFQKDCPPLTFRFTKAIIKCVFKITIQVKVLIPVLVEDYRVCTDLSLFFNFLYSSRSRR